MCLGRSPINQMWRLHIINCKFGVETNFGAVCMQSKSRLQNHEVWIPNYFIQSLYSHHLIIISKIKHLSIYFCDKLLCKNRLFKELFTLLLLQTSKEMKYLTQMFCHVVEWLPRWTCCIRTMKIIISDAKRGWCNNLLWFIGFFEFDKSSCTGGKNVKLATLNFSRFDAKK